LITIDRTQVTGSGSPFVPDTDAVFLQVADVGVALQEPQQFVDDRLEVHLFGGDKGEALSQIKPHLVTEHTEGAGAGAIPFLDAFAAHMGEQLKVLLHVRISPR